MAVSKGNNSEKVAIKRYTGVAPCYVLAVNPDEKKAAELLGYEAPIQPYVTKAEVEGKEMISVRLDFIVKTAVEKCGVELTGKLTFFLQKAHNQGSRSGKFEVVDKYGRFAWATKEDITNKVIPTYNCKDGSTMKANIADGYRLSYVGESLLMDFIKNYLVIPNVQKWDAKEKKFKGLIDNPADAEARLDKIEDYFKGKFDELNKMLTYQPTNTIKLLFGVRSYEKEGQMRTVQTIYNRMTLSNRVTDYKKFENEIKERKANGGLSDTEFTFGDIKEYSVEATDFSTPSNTTSAPASDPFADAPAVQVEDTTPATPAAPSVDASSDLPWG